jgi:hypothetical protein
MEPARVTVLLDTRTAAARLGLKPQTMERWRWSGDGPPFVKVGRCVRYREAVLEAYIEAGLRSSTSDRGAA